MLLIVSSRSRAPRDGVGARSQQLHVIPLPLLPQPIRQSTDLRHQFRVHPAPFPQLDHDRIIGAERPKALRVGLQRPSQQPGIPPIILGPSDARPIAEGGQLLRVDTERRDPTLQQDLHHRTTGHLDRHREPGGIIPHALQQPCHPSA